MKKSIVRDIKDLNINNSATGKKIYVAARKLFLEKGYKGTTVRDIAKEADVNLGLVNYHYNSKSNLAQLIGKTLMAEMIEDIQKETENLELANIEKFYIDNVLSWTYTLRDPGYARFFIEFLIYSDQCDTMTPYFYEGQCRILEDYGLLITQEENQIYWMTFKGSEKLLLGKRWLGEIDVTYAQILETMMRDYFFNIGIERTEIEKIIEKCSGVIMEITK